MKLALATSSKSLFQISSPTLTRRNGWRRRDQVACLLRNISPILVSHFVVPLAGAALGAINTRLSNDEVQCILGHSGATLLIACRLCLETCVADVLKPAHCPRYKEKQQGRRFSDKSENRLLLS